LSINKLKFFIFVSLLILSILISSNVIAAQDNSSQVLFDETGPYGKYYTIYSIGPWGASSFATLLQENGFRVSRLTEMPITSEKLKGYNVLILMAPARNYNDEEINDIKAFVSNGGGLLLLGDVWGVEDGDENYSFNKLARSFGVDFTYNNIVTDLNHFIEYSYYVKIKDIKSHPITANVPGFYHLMGTYIKIPGSSNVIAYSDADSWADQEVLTPEGYSQNDEQKSFNETSGPLPVLSVMEYGKGKIVFMGAVSTFVNSWIYRDNGWKLGLNSVYWLADRPVPSNYKTAGLISYNIGDMEYRILIMAILTILLITGLIFKIRSDKKIEGSQPIKTITNRKYNALIVLNAFFALLTGLLFIPINFYTFDILSDYYDLYYGYILIITGVLLLFFIGIILYNIIARQRLLAKYSYFNIAIILFFAGLTVILGDIFSFPFLQLFTICSLVLIIPYAINLWVFRDHGPDLIIEGKEFDRLKRLSVKSLPYELHANYTNSAYIGEGGFGRVFKANRRDGEEVAIKIPKSFDKRSENIFVSEVSNWSHLDHPNIVKLNDFKIFPIPYIEMEFCDGYLEHGQKTLKEAISIVYNIAKGLQYAHEKNIIHGDIKTSNIMIKNGIYKISDWGLSKLKTGESVTLSGATPQYAAPEQISSEFGKADERTDIYQLGTVFYELLTGILPFKGEISEIYNSILRTQPMLPSEINPDAGKVEDIIMKCLNKNKDDRYSSMDELLDQLEKYRPADETTLFDNDMEKKA